MLLTTGRVRVGFFGRGEGTVCIKLFQLFLLFRPPLAAPVSQTLLGLGELLNVVALDVEVDLAGELAHDKLGLAVGEVARVADRHIIHSRYVASYVSNQRRSAVLVHGKRTVYL